MMEIYKYKDYEEYKRIQLEGTEKKKDKVWVQRVNIQFLSKYIKSKIEKPKLGLCHGTRKGREQQWFMKYIPDSYVLGTEISPLAKEFPNTIEWDFHKIKSSWKGKMDFIYSNSLDHSFDPKRAIKSWCSCLNKNGMLLIEHTSHHEISSELDPFGATVEELSESISKWTKEKFHVSEVLSGKDRSHASYVKFLVVTHTKERRKILDFFK